MKNKIILLVEDLYSWYYRKFLNPWNFSIQGWCPRQAWGEIELHGHKFYYYFRARGSGWSFDLSKTEEDWWAGKKVFTTIDANYKVWPECGYLPEWECIKLANIAIKKYRNTLVSEY